MQCFDCGTSPLYLVYLIPLPSTPPSGGIEPGSLTLAPCIEYVDEWVTVTEEEIRAAMVGMLQNHSKLVEGAAACAVAALLKRSGQGSACARGGGQSIAGGTVADDVADQGSSAAQELQTPGPQLPQVISAPPDRRSAVIICCGGNVSVQTLQAVLGSS